MLTHSKYQLHEVASTDSTRPVLNSVFVDSDFGKAVATNGTAMAIVPMATLQGDKPKAIVPSDVWRNASKLGGKHGHVELTLKDETVEWMTKTGNASAKYVPGEYPNYKQVMPEIHEDRQIKICFDAEQLLALAKAIGAGGLAKGSKFVTMTIDREDLRKPYIVTTFQSPEAIGILMPAMLNKA